MPLRKLPLITGEYYHIYNRSIAQQPTFLDKRDHDRFLLALNYYHFLKPPIKLSRFLQLPKHQKQKFPFEFNNTKEKLVEIVSFVLMPNHFHLLLKQTADNGISNFLSRLTNSYIRYFNTKNSRLGPLFQGVFKAVRIETDEQLIHLSRYIHLNPLVSCVIKESNLFSYNWSSLPSFFGDKLSFIDNQVILSYFPNIEAYRSFLLDQVDYAKKLEEIKHILIEPTNKRAST